MEHNLVVVPELFTQACDELIIAIGSFKRAVRAAESTPTTQAPSPIVAPEPAVEPVAEPTPVAKPKRVTKPTLAPPPPPEPQIDYAQVSEVVLLYAAINGKPAAIELLKREGYAHLREVPADRYAQLIDTFQGV